MSRLLKSTAILAFARSTNFVLLLLSPILLVRFLDPHTFGQYREFLAYAMLASMLAAFSAKSNLLYFIPKDAERTRAYVSNTAWIVLGTSTLACLVLFLFRDLLLADTSFDMLVPLAVYVLLFTNMDFLETYWLARREARNVLYYSVTRTVVRLITVIGVAIYSPKIESLVTALIAVEAVRIVAVLVIMWRSGLGLLSADRTAMRHQLSFIVPLGLAGSLHYLNQYAGQIAIATQLGVVALAVYSIGSYQLPVLTIIRGSVNDSIFPDMVREAAGQKGDQLSLWKRSNVAYTSLIVPIFVLLLFYADVLIPLIFTARYAEAVPIFRIMVSIMLIQCFEFSSPLRAVNRNRILLAGNALMLCTNLALIFVLFGALRDRAIYAPAIAIVAAYVVQLAFFGYSITSVYSLPVRDLMKWHSLGLIALSAAASSIVLAAGELSAAPDLLRVALFSPIFLVCYYLLIRRTRLEEVETLMHTVARKLQRA